MLLLQWLALIVPDSNQSHQFDMKRIQCGNLIVILAIKNTQMTQKAPKIPLESAPRLQELLLNLALGCVRFSLFIFISLVMNHLE